MPRRGSDLHGEVGPTMILLNMKDLRLRVLLCAAAFLATTHPLPAPIFEIPEKATPTPTPAKKARPAPEPQPKSRPKPPVEPKSKPEPTRETIRPPSAQKSGLYAGTWRGIINMGLPGNIEYTIVIDPGQTMVKMWDTRTPAQVTKCAATIGGTGISWPCGGMLGEGRVTLKPYPDGNTAQLRWTAILFDSSGVFVRREK